MPLEKTNKTTSPCALSVPHTAKLEHMRKGALPYSKARGDPAMGMFQSDSVGSPSTLFLIVSSMLCCPPKRQPKPCAPPTLGYTPNIHVGARTAGTVGSTRRQRIDTCCGGPCHQGTKTAVATEAMHTWSDKILAPLQKRLDAAAELSFTP